MANTENITIKTYNDFVEQLKNVKNSEVSIVLSFYKYCFYYDGDNDFKYYKKLILEELEPFGLHKPFKVTKDMNLIYRYKKQAEAVILIKPFRVDLMIMPK